MAKAKRTANKNTKAPQDEAAKAETPAPPPAAKPRAPSEPYVLREDRPVHITTHFIKGASVAASYEKFPCRRDDVKPERAQAIATRTGNQYRISIRFTEAAEGFGFNDPIHRYKEYQSPQEALKTLAKIEADWLKDGKAGIDAETKENHYSAATKE